VDVIRYTVQNKIFIFAVLERWLHFNETEFSFVYLVAIMVLIALRYLCAVNIWITVPSRCNASWRKPRRMSGVIFGRGVISGGPGYTHREKHRETQVAIQFAELTIILSIVNWSRWSRSRLWDVTQSYVTSPCRRRS